MPTIKKNHFMIPYLSKLAESDVAESPVEDRADQDCNRHHKVGGVN